MVETNHELEVVVVVLHYRQGEDASSVEVFFPRRKRFPNLRTGWYRGSAENGFQVYRIDSITFFWVSLLDHPPLKGEHWRLGQGSK